VMGPPAAMVSTACRLASWRIAAQAQSGAGEGVARS